MGSAGGFGQGTVRYPPALCLVGGGLCPPVPLPSLFYGSATYAVPRPEHHHENLDMADFASCPVVMAGFKAPSQGGKWVLIELTLLPGAPRGGDEIGGGGGGRSWSESPPG